MRKTVQMFAAGLVCTALVATVARSEGPFRERLKQRMEQRADKQGSQAPVSGGIEMAYGPNALQKLDYWKASDAKAPLVIFVHGGGWKRGDKRNGTGSAKVSHLREQGYAVASLNYRLVPDATVEDQASDVARAIAYLLGNAAKLGFDPARVVLMGHSAGAHLSALVGTDTDYLSKAGVSPGALSGIILLDGAAYDVPSQMGENARLMGDTYAAAFGTDPARQRALSPTLQVQAPNVTDFLILHVDRDDGTRQSEALAKALRGAGVKVELKAIAGRGLMGHMQINRKLGQPDYEATSVVDAYIKRVVGAAS